MKTEMAEKLITKRQLADYLGVHPRTITRMVTAGQIPAIHVGKVAVRFRLSDVLAALEKQESG